LRQRRRGYRFWRCSDGALRDLRRDPRSGGTRRFHLRANGGLRRTRRWRERGRVVQIQIERLQLRLRHPE